MIVPSTYRQLSRAIKTQLEFAEELARMIQKIAGDHLEDVCKDYQWMAKYVNGLLATQLWWSNHTEILRLFHDNFLEILPNGFQLLDVGEKP